MYPCSLLTPSKVGDIEVPDLCKSLKPKKVLQLAIRTVKAMEPGEGWAIRRQLISEHSYASCSERMSGHEQCSIHMKSFKGAPASPEKKKV